MLSFKIWPLVLALYSFIVDRNHVVLSVTYVLSSEKRNLNTVVGGYVDNLFGKCVEGNFDGSTYKLSYAERSLLNNIGTDFLRIGLDFSDLYVQCVFRGLILKFRLQDERMDIVKLCGEMPIEVIDNYKEEYTAADSEKLDALSAEELMPAKKFIGRLKSFDFKEIPEEEAFGEGLEFQKGVIRRFPDRPMRTWAFDETSKIHEHQLLEDGKMVVKRFNRDKVVKFGTAEFDRRTKNTIWLRLLKPVNYIEADNILQELSENMHIRPPIAQFQLDKTGHVLLFFVPFETGLVASDVLNMMRQNAQWMKQNKVFQYGIGMPVLTEPIAAPHTVGKIEHLPETGDYAMGGMGRRQSNGNTGVGGHLSRVGFVAVVVVCSLAVLVALLLVAHILVRRRDRLNDYLAGPICKGPRKPSERPLVPPASPSASIAASAGRNDSLEKQHQETLSSCSTTSPPPYQETPEQGEKQGIFRRQIVSTGGSEASTESMASAPSHRTTQLSSNLSCTVEGALQDSQRGNMLSSRRLGSMSSLSSGDMSSFPSVPTQQPSRDIMVFRRYRKNEEPRSARKTSRMGILPTIPSSYYSPLASPLALTHGYNYSDVLMVKMSNEPVQMTLDVTTGHLILSYMEEHLRNRDRLDADWEEVNTYESEEAVPCESAKRPENAHKNREGCPIPYEQTRVMLSCRGNGYINASLMYDHDPRNPSYIAAETPLLSTVGDFWQMVWEQFSVLIVCLEPESALTQVIEDLFNITGQGDDDVTSQARYWPPEGSMIFGKFEVRLVSEHRQCSDYITRSFYLKERDSGETRTVTQFHFLSWPEDTPSCELKTLLEFRRKVNKSFRAKNSPAVVHCRDGSSKTGTYLLLDLVLSRISKGVKELDVAASLEHLRDQRQGMIKSKAQFELVLAAIAEEVNMMLNSAAS
ncbi:receptor type tyrosine protein phosphatase [Echinococcus multilocularis]|uniref:Receptor type tyrosine protein phosphatase n=1 Tax=Echinococcus multilocularis TaxID=6211 RepID=A0A068YKQ3_ECHMU|nr:receptor type tyrosine protein phosphatase [Echinococcus multilocularis]